MKNSLISIIIPIYNVEHYLEKCLYSIMNQTYKNIEVILIDDGSTDNSRSICKKFKLLDDRFNIIYTKHCGVSHARNIGLELAHGDYIGFVDSDDYIELDMYEKMYTNMYNTNSDIVICGFHIFQYPCSSRKKKLDKTVSFKYEELNMNDAMYKLIEDKEMKSYLWNKLFKKELWNNIKFSKNKVLEDYEIMHMLFMKSNKVTTIQNNLYHYRMRYNNLTSSFDSQINQIFDSYEKRRLDLKETIFYNKYIIIEINYIKRKILKYFLFNQYDFVFYEKIKNIFIQILLNDSKHIGTFEFIKNKFFLYIILFLEKIRRKNGKFLFIK